ncbi:MAG: twitching motility protein PilT, partial [Alphaproteobacteria bacterium]|nr:twitching motility protein PilT [Alphaproteobacteria bacterium]
MKGLDTNVLVRFLVKDDAPQARREAAYIRAECRPDRPCLVNRIVLCELDWVLASAYGYPRAEIAGVVEKLLRADALLVEDSETA